RSNRRLIPNIVKPEIRTIAEIVPMADRTMEELLQAPTEGDVPNDAIKLMLFPYSLEGAARICGLTEHDQDSLNAAAGAEESKEKSSIEESPELELKELPSHLEPWVSPIHCVPKKGGMTVVANENNELIPKRLVTSWRVSIDYRKLNDATRKDHFPLPFMDQMLERLARNEFYCFLDGFLGYFQILIDPQDQEKTTFTCPHGTFTY
nr:reverse transcriptase domain-containing protein [Tanacetum cinerariifolium]